jgi:hypothetical protein
MIERWIQALRVGALFAVAAIAGINVVHTARKTPPPPVGVPAEAFDPLSRYEARLAALRQGLQARGLRGTLGYFGDQPEAGDDFFYAQFVLAPLVLDLRAEHYAWGVADLRTASPETRLPEGWRVVEAFGSGVFLVRQSAP